MKQVMIRCIQRTVFTALIGVAVLGVYTVPGPLAAQNVGEEEVAARQRALQRDLDRVEAEIAEQQKILDERRQDSASLARDVAILDAEIRKSQLAIEARELTIQKLTGEIGVRETTIGDLTEKMLREKESLAQLIRKTDQIDGTSLVEVVLGNQNLSEFFEDLDSFTNIKASLHESFREIEDTKSTTQVEKRSLEDRRTEELRLKEIQVLEKQKIERQEREKAQLLEVSRGIEAGYQAIIAVKQQSAAQIRAQLFALRGSTAISFGEALDLANSASKLTGVRPALILGVIQEETRLGEFLGNGNWRTDMHPTRDQPVFEQLMAELGLDPDSMPVSAAPSYGWGGAMGPAQFIPSTWVLYKDRIAQVTGHNPPNPYDAFDAFTASALLLADNGADRGTRAAERLAALRYFAGWANAEKPAYAFYGDEVMGLADGFQIQIDILARS
ncbi:lytic murein transglycosylase [Candidatus Wolfebacteria bacterium]|nr:lytic murein transglycosylase [Candidatus Wolfebacteria bacterium]